MKNNYEIRCGCHTYITLTYNESFIACYDNDFLYMEEIIYLIEKRTKIPFTDLNIKGALSDFSGLGFYNGGYHRNLWQDYPGPDEISAYMRLKRGEMHD